MDLIPRKFYLDDFFDNLVSCKDTAFMKCDIYEYDTNYHIEMDIPGFNRSEIQIEAKSGYLTITAEKKQEKSEEERNYIRKERNYDKYARSFYLGDLESDKIEANFVDGVLQVIIPKKELIETKKYIEIK